MTKNFYAIYDTKAGIFQMPFTEYNDATAIRAIADIVNDEKRGILLSDNSEDFQLFKIGFYDPIKGEFTNDQKALVKLFELKRRGE